MADVAFNEADHTYTLAGRRLPSVTEILDPLNELDGIPRDVLAAAAAFGSHVHLACHLHSEGRLDRAALDPALEPYLGAWESFLAATGAKVIASEARVSHPIGYAGTLDNVIEWRGRRHVVDIKTSAAVPRTVGPQTAAYREAWLQEHKRDLSLSVIRYCVHLRPDGTYRLHKLADPSDWSIFVSTLNIWNWRNR